MKELEGLGFSEKEARIYELLAREGPYSAPKIASVLGIERRTAYDTLNNLFRKGLIIKNKLEGVEVYSAMKPELIEDEFRAKLEDFKSIIPNLQRKEGAEFPVVNTLFGPKAVRLLVSNASEYKGEILLMGRGGYLIEQLGEAKHQFMEKLKKMNLRMIQTEDYKKYEKEFKPEKLKYLPKIMKFDTAFSVFGNKVYLFSKYKEIFLIEILDKSFADTFRQYFEVFWKIAKR